MEINKTNSKNTHKSSLTPQELADKLEKIMDFNRVSFPFSNIKEIHPELYEQLIKPGLEVAYGAGKICRTPKPLYAIMIDKDLDNMSYDPTYHELIIGLPYLRKQQSMREAIAVISHEWGHVYHSYAARGSYYETNKNKDKKRTTIVEQGELTPNKLLHLDELHADRFAEPIDKIASSLQAVISDLKKYNYDDKNIPHPNHRKRIKQLLEKALSNEIFGMNGEFIEKNGNYSFIPDSLGHSPKIIKNTVRKNIGEGKIHPDPYGGFPVSEDGRLVKNGYPLRVSTEKKAEELMQKLDTMVESGLDLEKKKEWLGLIKREIKDFKEKNEPEFVDKKDIPTRKWMNRMNSMKPLNLQRGG
ncbi:MAG: hypothetical protein R3D71_10260 [Rickettsiales bacterium]